MGQSFASQPLEETLIENLGSSADGFTISLRVVKSKHARYGFGRLGNKSLYMRHLSGWRRVVEAGNVELSRNGQQNAVPPSKAT